MTNPINLNLLWALAGGITDPDLATPGKYEAGWVAEIPTYQNFNFVLNALDNNLLSLAESGIFPWQDLIAYKAGVRVSRSNKVFTCIQSHNDAAGINTQDPDLDATNSYWVHGMVLGDVDPSTLASEDGLKIDQINSRTATAWSGNDLTLNNANALVSLKTLSAGTKNWLMGNISGEICVVDVGTTTTPDGRNIALSQGTVHQVYHEGFKPTQADVSDTIPANPQDGLLYGRRDGNWVEVTGTKVQSSPPPPVTGNGQGWFNLDDGILYIDVDDGDSSQWTPASPMLIPTVTANTIEYDDTLTGLGSDVQLAITNLADRSNKNLIINGDFDLWQRSISEVISNATGFVSDRWDSTSSGSVQTVTRESFTPGQTSVPNNPKYFHRTNRTSADITPNYIQRQFIEGVDTLSGGKATITFWAKANASKSIRVALQQSFGTGGAPSTQVYTTIFTPTIGVGWVKYSATVDIPSISGKTLGTNGDHTLVLYFSEEASFGTFTLDIAQVQFEEGQLSTSFEKRSIAAELALCQRYFEIVEIYLRLDGYSASAGASANYAVRKRRIPTSTTRSNANGNVTGMALQIVREHMVAYAGTFSAVTPTYIFSEFNIDAEYN